MTPKAIKGKQSTQKQLFKHYLIEHRQVVGESIDQLWSRPMVTLMTITLIGLTLALPLIFMVFLDNGNRLVGSWQGQSKITLYMAMDMTPDQSRALADTLSNHHEVRALDYLSPQQSLLEFERSTGITVPLDLLGGNPLPAMLIVEAHSSNPNDLSRLRDEFMSLSEVEYAQLDLLWVKRLKAMLDLGMNIVQALILILAVVVLLVIMNSLKLLIEHRRSEIEITMLVGGSKAYVRRPFIYLGFWYGFLGGLLSVTAVELLLWWIERPLLTLTAMYESNFRLLSMSLPLFFQVLLFSSLLGICAAWLEASLHLRRILPR